jgi:hypothetical protein
MNNKFIQPPPGLISKNFSNNHKKYDDNYINEIVISCVEYVLNENNLFNNQYNKKKK